VKKQLFLRPSQAGAQFTQERKPVTELDSVSPAHEPLPGDEQTGKRNTVAGGGSSGTPGAKTSQANGNGKKKRAGEKMRAGKPIWQQLLDSKAQ
jgi:hypothetical protein